MWNCSAKISLALFAHLHCSMGIYRPTCNKLMNPIVVHSAHTVILVLGYGIAIMKISTIVKEET